MQRYSVRLQKVGTYAAPAYTPPDDLVLTPTRWSASDRGGMRQCEVLASGSAQSLVYLTGWLGDRLEIYNEQGDLLWHGLLWDLEINTGNVTYTSSLENVYNRVAVIYPFTLADGSVESRTTTWVEDAISVARYGKRELLYGMPESFSQSADTVRDTLLARFKDVAPVVQTSGGSNETGARLVGQGVWQKAASIYFKNLDGLLEHTGETTSFTIGSFMVSTLISFGEATPGGDADEMYISSGSFDPLTTDDTFTVSGSVKNNDTYTIQHQDASNQITIGGSFESEAAGATVKLSKGESISYENAAQSFSTTTTWVCTHIAIKVRQVGSPADNFRIGLYPDSGGVPGTLISVAEVPGSTLYTELEWFEFTLPAPVTLTAGVTYWVAFRRTGATTLANGYEVALDEDLGYSGGVARFYNGTAWIAGTPDVDIPFRLIGEIDSTEQIGKALAVVDDFTQVLMQVDSNVPIRQYSDEDKTAIEEINEMLDAGSSTGARLVAYTLPDDTVVIAAATEATFGQTLPILSASGKLKYGGGGFYPPGRLIYGQAIDLEGLLLFDALGVRGITGPGIYVVESEFDAETQTLSVRSEGALDPWTALTTMKG
jgi:hypothetical protein